MEPIMVGVDGSPASLDACSWAGGLAREHDAHVVVVSVLPRPAAPLLPPPYVERRNRQLNVVHRWCAEHGLGSVPYGVVVVEGQPVRTLADLAERREADLLIVGTDGAHGRFGPRLGSVANQLAHRVPAPLLVVPVGRAWRGLTDVVVGVDGSPASLAAVELVGQLLRRGEGRVTAVAVDERLAEWVPNSDPVSLYRDARRELERWAAPLAQAGHCVDHRLSTEGHPAPAILGVAAEVDADLVVVGAQRFATVLPVHFGGTALQLLHRAATPTMLVPVPSGDRRAVDAPPRRAVSPPDSHSDSTSVGHLRHRRKGVPQ